MWVEEKKDSTTVPGFGAQTREYKNGITNNRDDKTEWVGLG